MLLFVCVCVTERLSWAVIDAKSYPIALNSIHQPHELDFSEAGREFFSHGFFYFVCAMANVASWFAVKLLQR